MFLSVCHLIGVNLCVFTEQSSQKNFQLALVSCAHLWTHHSTERVGIFWLVRLLTLAKPCALETGGPLRINHCIRTTWGSELLFPEGKGNTENLTIDVHFVTVNTMRDWFDKIHTATKWLIWDSNGSIWIPSPCLLHNYILFQERELGGYLPPH